MLAITVSTALGSGSRVLSMFMCTNARRIAGAERAQTKACEERRARVAESQSDKYAVTRAIHDTNQMTRPLTSDAPLRVAAACCYLPPTCVLRWGPGSGDACLSDDHDVFSQMSGLVVTAVLSLHANNGQGSWNSGQLPNVPEHLVHISLVRGLCLATRQGANKGLNVKL